MVSIRSSNVSPSSPVAAGQWARSRCARCRAASGHSCSLPLLLGPSDPCHRDSTHRHAPLTSLPARFLAPVVAALAVSFPGHFTTPPRTSHLLHSGPILRCPENKGWCREVGGGGVSGGVWRRRGAGRGWVLEAGPARPGRWIGRADGDLLRRRPCVGRPAPPGCSRCRAHRGRRW